jgi:hypothetical protein
MSQDRNDSERQRGADDIEVWLIEHPEARGDLADLQRLRELVQSAYPPEPDEDAWLSVRTRIHDAPSMVRPERRRSPRPLWAALSLSAAAVLAAVLLVRSGWMSGPRPQVPPVEDEAFPVVEADDVTIISMDARDVAALVVGEPPVSGELIFAQPADVRVIKCERCPHSGNVPRLAQGDVPMVVTTVARTDVPDDD